MNRYDCHLTRIESRPQPEHKPVNNRYSIDNGRIKVVINSHTGLLEHYEVNGRTILGNNAFRALVIRDNEDAWGMQTKKFRRKAGTFKLMTAKQSAAHAGVKAATLAAVRIVEQGEVRTVIETSMQYKNSFMLLTYKIPANGTELEVEVRVTWNEKDKMLKLSLPLDFIPQQAYGQTAYGFHNLPMNGSELVVQKWLTINSGDNDASLRVIDNGIYGCDIKNKELRLSLLRSPAYSGHPIKKRCIVPQDRFTPRIDQGERIYWVGKSLTVSNETLAVGILRMIDCSGYEDGTRAFRELDNIIKDAPKSLNDQNYYALSSIFTIISILYALLNNWKHKKRQLIRFSAIILPCGLPAFRHTWQLPPAPLRYVKAGCIWQHDLFLKGPLF